MKSCLLATVVVLTETRNYYELECRIERGTAILETGVYDPLFFDGKPCGDACASTSLDNIGTVAPDAGGQSMLFTMERAQNTLEAILASRHCKCRIKTSMFSFLCDCSLWQNLQEEKWGKNERAAAPFRATLQKFNDAATKLRHEVETIVALSEHELKLLCSSNNNTCAPLRKQIAYTQE
jgi:hypothetical protein